MSIILILLMVITLYKAKLIKKGINKEYISIETTKMINGIFVLIVFLSHSMQYINYTNSWLDKYGIFIISNIGQLMVTTFLFFSGYGIYESIKSKKDDYINNIPKKRILTTFIKFDIAVIVFVLVSYILNIKYDVKTIILSFFGWESVGNSNWYIFAILMLYIITYLIFKLIKTNNLKKIILVTLSTMIYILIISNFKEAWWYDTILCYPIGMWFSFYKQKIEEKFENNMKYYYISLIVLTIILLVSFVFRYNIYIYSTIFVMAFVLLIILFSMKVKLNSKFLKYMGNNVFYIYIYQRIPMMIFSKYNIYFGNRYLFLIFSFVATLVITEIINKFKIKPYKREVKK